MKKEYAYCYLTKAVTKKPRRRKDRLHSIEEFVSFKENCVRVRVLARVEGYAMVKIRGARPFVIAEKELKEKSDGTD